LCHVSGSSIRFTSLVAAEDRAIRNHGLDVKKLPAYKGITIYPVGRLLLFNLPTGIPITFNLVGSNSPPLAAGFFILLG
jgi:hypothetical protein